MCIIFLILSLQSIIKNSISKERKRFLLAPFKWLNIKRIKQIKNCINKYEEYNIICPKSIVKKLFIKININIDIYLYFCYTNICSNFRSDDKKWENMT